MDDNETDSIGQLIEELTENLGEVKTTTPVSLAGTVIENLMGIYDQWGLDENEDFMKFIFDPLWHDEDVSGQKQFDEIKETEELTEVNGEPLVRGLKEALISFNLMFSSCAYVIQCFKAEKNSPEAWQYAFDANRMLGVLQGFISGRYYGSIEAASKHGEKGGNAKGNKYKPLSELAKALVQNREFHSVRSAAITIKDHILEEAKRNDIRLSETQIIATISGWIKSHTTIKK